MNKRLGAMVLKTKHWGLGFDVEVMAWVTVIDLTFGNRTLRVRLRNNAQLREQDKRMAALKELTILQEQLEGENK